jgi:hypothetical protein
MLYPLESLQYSEIQEFFDIVDTTGSTILRAREPQRGISRKCVKIALRAHGL